MREFRFESPGYLLLLLGLVIFYYAIKKIQGRSDEALLRFVSATNLSQLLKGRTGTSSMLRKYALWLGLASLVIALARPQANPVLEERDQASLDIIVLLDVSRSMDAEDIAPSRLKKAKKSIVRLLDQLSGDRVGLLAFAGSAALITPLTSDYEMIKSSLPNIDTSMIESQGTNFATALNLALSAMERGAQSAGSKLQRNHIFLLMSDGEDHHKEDLDAVDQIKAKNGTIFSIAFGTEKGVPIPVRDAQGELAGYKRDHSGNPVLTKVNPSSMQKIAERGGGQFYFSTLDEGEIFDILKRTQGMERLGGATIKAKMYQEYFYPFLVAGFLLLMFTFIPVRWMIEQIVTLKFGRNAALFLLLLSSTSARANPLSFLWSKERQASEESMDLASKGKMDEALTTLKKLQADNPDSPELNYNIGTLMLEGKKFSEGREQLERSLTQKENQIHTDALFNIAGSFAQEGKKDEARSNYAELIQSLSKRENRSKKEEALLENAKANLAYLANPQNDKKQNQQSNGGGGGEGKNDQNKENDPKNQDQKNNDSQKNGDQKKDQNKDQDNKEGKNDQDKKDQQNKDKEEKKDDKQKDGEKGEQEKKEKEGQDKKDGDQGQTPPPQPQNGQGQQIPQNGRQPFKERDDMGEEEAKQILEALKQQESKLQKKFLKNKDGKGKLENDDDPQDW